MGLYLSINNGGEDLALPRDPSPEYKWTASANRVKRRALKPPSNKKTCSLFIQTDPLLWNHIWAQVTISMKKDIFLKNERNFPYCKVFIP